MKLFSSFSVIEITLWYSRVPKIVNKVISEKKKASCPKSSGRNNLAVIRVPNMVMNWEAIEAEERVRIFLELILFVEFFYCRTNTIDFKIF